MQTIILRRRLITAIAVLGTFLPACDYFAYDVLHSRGGADAGTPPVEECPTGLAECDGVASTICETKLNENPSHCGACDLSCEGGACQEGLCLPVPLKAEPEVAPSGMRATSTGLVWATKGGETIRMYNSASKEISTLLSVGSASPAPTASVKLEIDGVQVYWVNPEERIVRTSTWINPSVQVLSGIEAVDIALGANELFWLTPDHRLMRRPIAGGTAVEVAANLKEPGDLTGGETAIYWRDGDGLARYRLQEKDVQRTIRNDQMYPRLVTNLSLTQYNGAEYYCAAVNRNNGVALVLECQDSVMWDMITGGTFAANNAPYARSVVGDWSPRRGLGSLEGSQVYWLTSALGTDRVGDVWLQDSRNLLGRKIDVRGSELAIQGKYLFLSNVESGFMSRMVR